MANQNVPKFEDTEEIVGAPSFDDTEDVDTSPNLLDSLISGTKSAGRGLLQGVTSSFADEGAGSVDALSKNSFAENLPEPLKVAATLNPLTLSTLLGNKAKDLITGDTSIDKIKEDYTKGRDEARAANLQAERDNPGIYGAAELGGAILTPAIGAVGAVKGGAAALKAAVASGALGAGLATVGEADELENIDPVDLGLNTALGGALGAGAVGVGKVLKGAGKMIKESNLGQKASKTYEKTKRGIDLVSKDARETFNKDLLGVSEQVVDEVVGSAKKFKKQYGDAIDKLKIANPQNFKKEIDELITEIAENQAEGRGINVLTVDATINKLRAQKRLNDDDLIRLKDAIMKKAADLKADKSAAGFKASGKSIENIEGAKDLLSVKTQLQDRIRQAQDELKEARRAYQDNPMDRAELKIEVRAKEDALTAIRREAQDLGFDATGTKLNISKANKTEATLDKANRDVISDTTGIDPQIDQLQKSNIDISRQIADLIEGKQEANNLATSGLLKELNLLKNFGPNTSFSNIKNENLNSIRSYATQLNRPDLVAKIDDIIKKNTPGAEALDKAYKDKIVSLKELGVSTDSMSGDIIKNSDAATYLTQQLKQATKDITGDAANKLAASENLIKNQRASQLIGKGKDIAESYNLSKEIADAPIKSMPLRGAVVAGNVVKSAPIQAMSKAVSRLGNSALGKKVQEVMSMPEGELRNRAIFTLMQQPWFRTASQENEK